MLVLSRIPGQEIVIGGQMIIKVIEIRGNRVRLGINAPKEVPVNRREVQDKLDQLANETPTTSTSDSVPESPSV